MKQLLFAILLLGTLAQAENAKLLEIISENVLRVEHAGKIEKVHLAGISLFATANNKINAFENISHNERDQLKQETLEYLKSKLPVGSTITYNTFYTGTANIKKIWLDNHELNYRMIRDGYAIVDLEDKALPTVFQNRMTIAMKYAKNKALGLWSKSSNAMLALVDVTHHMCGWENTPKHVGLNRLAILKAHQESLPKSARLNHPVTMAMRTH
jgi:hypothetical protein